MMTDSMSFYTKLYIITDHLSKDIWIWIVILLTVGALMFNVYRFNFSSDSDTTVADRKERVVVDVFSISILAICLAIVLIDNYTYWKLTKLGMSYNEIHNLIINLEHACR